LVHEYRSPWTNEYIPANTSGPTPSSKLRQLEVSLNTAFDTYRDLYFEGGVSSVYLWDLDEDPSQSKEMSFAGVVLLKKGESLISLTTFIDSVRFPSIGGEADKFHFEQL
jgi:hypothetical protein